MKALVKRSAGKAIQRRSFGYSVGRRTSNIEIFCAHPLPKSALFREEKKYIPPPWRRGGVYSFSPCYFKSLEMRALEKGHVCEIVRNQRSNLRLSCDTFAPENDSKRLKVIAID